MLWKLPTIREIASIRKQLGMSQYRLAKTSKVSQAMINKFEREQVDMGYSKVIRVCTVLTEAFNHQLKESANLANLCAKDIMEQKIIWIRTTDKVIVAIDLMTKHGFSQLPVMEQGQQVGSITERILKNHLDRGIGPGELREKIAGKMMGPRFPEVSSDTVLEAVSIMLESCEAVLVRMQERIIGMITAADFMKLAKTPKG